MILTFNIEWWRGDGSLVALEVTARCALESRGNETGTHIVHLRPPPGKNAAKRRRPKRPPI